MVGGGVQESLLVHPDRPHTLEAGRVVDHGVRELGDGRVRGCPPDTELTTGRSDREPLDVDHVSQTGPGPFGHRSPRSYRVDVFGPRRHLTISVTAAPPSPSEHQHRRHPGDWKVPHLGTGPAVADSAGSTRRTRRHLPWCLDVEPPLAIDQHPGADHQLTQPHERGRALTTLDHSQGSLLYRRRTSAEWRGPWPRRWTPIPARPPHPPPHSTAESRIGVEDADLSEGQIQPWFAVIVATLKPGDFASFSSVVTSVAPRCSARIT